MKDYPNVPPDWYRNTDDQIPVVEVDWNNVDVK